MKKMFFVLFMSMFVLTGCSKEVTGTYLKVDNENFKGHEFTTFEQEAGKK